jgi:hypothetical protein
MYGKNTNGQQITVGHPTANIAVAFGAVTSVVSGLIPEGSVAVEVFSPLTTCFIALGPVTTTTATTAGVRIYPGVLRTFALKSARYIAAIGGGANGSGTLHITPLK